MGLASPHFEHFNDALIPATHSRITRRLSRVAAFN